MSNKNSKIEKRSRLKRKIRAKISGTLEVPRLSVFRSNSHIYAQIIDDVNAVTLVSASDKDMKGKNTEKSANVGLSIAKMANDKKITKVVFDRNGFKYTGRVKVLAEKAREGGLQF